MPRDDVQDAMYRAAEAIRRFGRTLGSLTPSPFTAMPRSDAAPPVATPTAAPEQFEILPAERPRPRLMNILVDRIEGYEGLEPSADFVESVNRMGILQPVAVVRLAPELNDGGEITASYRLAAGRRRVRAAQILGITTIPALVFPVGTDPHVAAAIAVSENNHRAPNPLTDLVAIEAMVAAGASEVDVARQLRLSRNTIRARMRLAALIPSLRARLEAGSLSVSLAERVARMPASRQEALFRATADEPRVTGTHVAQALRARQESAAGQIDDAVFRGAEPAFVVIDEAEATTGVGRVEFLDGATRGSTEELAAGYADTYEAANVIFGGPNEQSRIVLSGGPTLHIRGAITTSNERHRTLAVEHANIEVGDADHFPMIQIRGGPRYVLTQQPTVLAPGMTRNLREVVRDAERGQSVPHAPEQILWGHNRESLTVNGYSFVRQDVARRQAVAAAETAQRQAAAIGPTNPNVRNTRIGTVARIDPDHVTVAGEPYVSERLANSATADAVAMAVVASSQDALDVTGLSRDEVIGALVERDSWASAELMLEALQVAMPAHVSDAGDDIANDVTDLLDQVRALMVGSR